jgi:hypothetical protein
MCIVALAERMTAMPNCGGACADTFYLFSGPLPFTFRSLPAMPSAEVHGYGFAADTPWDQADFARFVARVQAFYDTLPPDDKLMMDAILQAGVAAIEQGA